jgi:pyruvate-formate lyase-activating enzyme
MTEAHARHGCQGILQVHPTRLCNLACAHCYSASSPLERQALKPDLIAETIEDAAGLGFNVVSLSGGEPLVYDGLDEVLAAARRVGSRVNLVSNGILIRSKRYERHAGQFSVVALSLDGLSDRHNQIRGSGKSFEQVRLAARELHRAGQQFGIIHTLCVESMDEVEDIAALASDWGASLLQLHPFEPTGRGSAGVNMTPLCHSGRLDAFLLTAILADNYPQMRIQLDLVHREVARRYPLAIHGAPLRQPMEPRELVLQEDGRVVPLTYGLDSPWDVTDLARQSLAASWADFIETRWPGLRRRLREACVAAARGTYGEVVAWHGLIRHYAAMQTHPAPAAELSPIRRLENGETTLDERAA